MSAIWGAINLNGNNVIQEYKSALRVAYDKCVIDRYEELEDKGVYMGCGIQYFTPESMNEALPYVDEKGNMFTADVVLDNRSELFNKLPLNIQSDCPDGELLYHYFNQFGVMGLNDLLGVYAFVFFDKNKKQVFLVTDSVGDRGLYYAVRNGAIFFSTLLEPLVKILKPQLNDRWIADFLAMDFLTMHSGAEDTPYMGIYRVAPANYVIISEQRIQKEQYWKPLENLREIRYKTDREYGDAFCKILKSAVEGTLRSAGETAALLSGGYDSTAVASVAAPILKSKGKKLHTYTSVPLKGYEARNDEIVFDDETDAVNKTACFLGNLVPEFVDMPGTDGWNGRKGEMEIMEMPYKSAQNMLWMPECMRKAYSLGARIMLNGSFGNTTISYSASSMYMNELFRRGKWIRLEKELRKFSKVFGFDVKYARKQVLKAKSQSKITSFEWKELYRKSFVSKALIAETNAEERMLAMKRRYAEAGLSYANSKPLIVQDIALRQIGEAETKHSLATGVLMRDPTKDKRIIEFCLNIPVECFTQNGEDRRLVSVYMRNIMPPHILECKAKGRQSADLQYRLGLNWSEIRQEWIDLYQKYTPSKYVDTAMALAELQQKADINDYKQFDLVRHIYTLMVLELEANNKEK